MDDHTPTSSDFIDYYPLPINKVTRYNNIILTTVITITLSKYNVCVGSFLERSV